MSRHKLREQLFKLLFRVEYFDPEEIDEQAELFLDSVEDLNDKDRAELKAKFEALVKVIADIDEVIGRNAKDWNLKRLGKVDLALLRLAVYEMKYDDSVPVAVAINEAVDLAKTFGEEGSGSFINGVLAGVSGEIEANG